MPRAFDDEERKTIESALLDAGCELIGRWGPHKTSVDDVTRYAGVAKGTFYRFWPSKEAFFFACIDRTEKTYQKEVVEPMMAEARDPAEGLAAIVSQGIPRSMDYPIIAQALDPATMQMLARKVPPEMLAAHQEEDRREFAAWLEDWKAKGFDPGIAPEVMDGLMKGFLLFALNQDIIGKDVFPDVMDTLGRLMSAGLKALNEENTE